MFEELFPNFLKDSLKIYRVLLPVTFIFVVIAIMAGGWSHSVRTIYGKVFACIAVVGVLLQFSNIVNTIQEMVEHVVYEELKASPEMVAKKYEEALTATKNVEEKKGFWERLFSADIFEAVMSAVLILISWFASILLFFAKLLQKAALYMGLALSPIFFGLLLIQSVRSIGVQYLMGMGGIALWPLGWAVASIMTDSLIDAAISKRFLSNNDLVGGAGYALQNLLAMALIAIWVIGSTLIAPLIIQRAVSTGVQVGMALMGGSAAAGGIAFIRVGGVAMQSGRMVAGVGAQVMSSTSTAAQTFRTRMSASSTSTAGGVIDSSQITSSPQADPEDLTANANLDKVMQRKSTLHQ